MQRRDVRMDGVASAGEAGLKVEVDELGRDAMRELKALLLGFPDDCLAPGEVHSVHPGRGGQLLRVPQSGIEARCF